MPLQYSFVKILSNIGGLYPPAHAYGDIFPFDGFDYPDVVEYAPHKFAISARNRYMALNADFIIAYVCCDYGGAYETVRAARNHDKPVIEIKMPADWAGCNIL